MVRFMSNNLLAHYIRLEKKKERSPLIVRLKHRVLFLGIFSSRWHFCSRFHHHSSIEESWSASERRCSPHLGDFKPVKQLRPPVSSMTLRTLLPLSFCLSTKTNHCHHSDILRRRRRVQLKRPQWTCEMTFQLPFTCLFTGDLFGEPVGQLDPESTLIDQVRHDSGALMNGFL